MHISEYVRKICYKELAIYLKCWETLKSFSQSNFNKNIVRPQLWNPCILKYPYQIQKANNKKYRQPYLANLIKVISKDNICYDPMEPTRHFVLF